MSDEQTTAADLARHVLAMYPDGTVRQWGEALVRMVDSIDDPVLAAWLREQLFQAAGRVVKNVKAQDERTDAPKVTYAGRPMTPTLSVATDRGRQLKLWLECSPSEFMEAVEREQAVVTGRANSNAARMKVVLLLSERPDLMVLPTLADVLAELGVEPDALDLDELDTGS